MQQNTLLPSLTRTQPFNKVISSSQRQISVSGSPNISQVFRSESKSAQTKFQGSSLSPNRNVGGSFGAQKLVSFEIPINSSQKTQQIPKNPFDSPVNAYLVKSNKFQGSEKRKIFKGALSLSSEIQNPIRQQISIQRNEKTQTSEELLSIPQSEHKIIAPEVQTQEIVDNQQIEQLQPSQSPIKTILINQQNPTPELMNKISQKQQQTVTLTNRQVAPIQQPIIQEIEESSVLESVQADVESPAKAKGVTKFRSYKEINEAHARHIEQRDALIEKWKNAHRDVHLEMRNKADLTIALEKTVKKNEIQLSNLYEELREKQNSYQVIQLKFNQLKEEMVAIRVDAANMHNLSNENDLLKQSYNIMIRKTKKLEESVAEQQNQYMMIRNWSLILNVPNPSLFSDFMVMKVADFQAILGEQDNLKKQLVGLSTQIRKLEEEAMVFEKEKAQLMEEIAIRNTKIELLLEPTGFSKVFKRFSEKGLDEIEKEIMKTVKIVQMATPSFDEGMVEQTIENIRTQLWALKNNQTQVLSAVTQVQKKFTEMSEILMKYPFLDEFNDIQKRADSTFKCLICQKTKMKGAITHIPCGHNVCKDCHREKELKFASSGKVSTDLMSTEINTCVKCGKHPQGNQIFPNISLERTFEFFQHLTQHIDNIKILILKP